MKDELGRGFFQRQKEKAFKKSQATTEEQREQLKKAMLDKSGKNVAALQKFVSLKTLLRAMLPQLIVGILIGIVEYELVGIIYTVVSLIIYVPLIYIYSRTLRNRTGTSIMVPTSDGEDWDLFFVSDEIWSLVEKKTGLTVENGKINNRVTYLCTDVKYLEGTRIPYYVEIAWKHYNTLKFGMYKSVLDDLTTMLKDTLLEVAKLKQTSDIKSITEGTRISREMIEAITSAHKDSIMSVLKKERLAEEEANVYEQQVNELLKNPEYLQALIKKRAGEEARQETP